MFYNWKGSCISYRSWNNPHIKTVPDTLQYFSAVSGFTGCSQMTLIPQMVTPVWTLGTLSAFQPRCFFCHPHDNNLQVHRTVGRQGIHFHVMRLGRKSLIYKNVKHNKMSAAHLNSPISWNIVYSDLLPKQLKTKIDFSLTGHCHA